MPRPAAKPTAPADDIERALDARLAQWRYINLVAVAELQAEEAAACAGLDEAADALEAAADDVARLTARLDAARGASSGGTFAARARRPLGRLVAALEEMESAEVAACGGVVRRLHALPMGGIVADGGAAAPLAREVARFRVAAAGFAAAVGETGGGDEGAASALEDLARVVAEEGPGVRGIMVRRVVECVEEEEAVVRAVATEVGKARKKKKRAGPFSGAFVPGVRA